MNWSEQPGLDPDQLFLFQSPACSKWVETKNEKPRTFCPKEDIKVSRWGLTLIREKVRNIKGGTIRHTLAVATMTQDTTVNNKRWPIQTLIECHLWDL